MSRPGRASSKAARESAASRNSTPPPSPARSPARRAASSPRSRSRRNRPRSPTPASSTPSSPRMSPRQTPAASAPAPHDLGCWLASPGAALLLRGASHGARDGCLILPWSPPFATLRTPYLPPAPSSVSGRPLSHLLSARLGRQPHHPFHAVSV